ncbi:hypothetical protein [Aurantimonas sp. 22II-16-19i]|uniref:DUF6894 family protein n=1 Tax=Aurantimonas sp. 22II-16-19i TaxID=1317114 RepID=UPI0009F801E9|nr:hypothetical protein [Aurantimonas sp. 22II-16-19i]ORE90284.1 hypothetical protein ATO4_21922 [Aurantimonas sp. 22II-16-19i]
MKMYFFDVSDNGNITRDDVGVFCVSDADVRQKAIEALPGLADEVLPDGDRHEISVIVREENEVYIFRATLLFTSHWLR